MVSLLPQLTAAGSLDTPPTRDGWAAEGKLDGARCMTEVLGHGDVRVVVGRNGSSYTGKLPYLEAVLAHMPTGTILDGELMAPGGSASGHGSSAVMGVMFANGPHVPTDRDPALVYVVFDILQLGGEDLRAWGWERRRAVLDGLAGVPHIELSPLYECSADGLAQAPADGYEGLVCKKRTGRYMPGRSRSWVKVKPQQTAVAIVRGFKPGEAGGRLAGMAGAFELEMLDEHDQPNGVLTRAKCGTDAIHQDATDHPERWLGQVIQIVHHGLSSSGVPRHPQVDQLRLDRQSAARTRRTAPTREREPMAGGPSARNYRAMGDKKLLACIQQLRDGSGDAYDRCVGQGCDPFADLDRARQAAHDRGLQEATPA